MFIAWNSQPLEEWAEKHARGTFVELPGGKTHYRKKGEGPRLLLIHGFFYDSYMWEENFDFLAQHFTVYAIDLWGFGYSHRDVPEPSYALYAKQVLEFMDAMSLEKAHLCGQSMGGGTSMLFCLKHPERVQSLTLVDSSGLPNPMPFTGKFFAFPGIGSTLMSLKTNSIRKKNLADFWIYDAQKITDHYFEEVTRFQKVKGTTPILLNILRKEFFDKLSSEIEQLSKQVPPCLIIWGKEDTAVPLHCGEQLHKMFSGSHLKVFEQAGHVPNFEQADTFNQEVLEFLQSC